MSDHHPVLGSCLCGGVSFELIPPFVLASYCHCEHCRKHSGNFGSASIQVPVERMRLLSGEELLERWQPAPGLAVKVFCSRCGSSLFGTREPEGETIWVRMGALDADPGLRPSRHVWAGSAPPWFPLPEDGLPHYADWPPRSATSPLEASHDPTAKASKKEDEMPEKQLIPGSCLCGGFQFEIEPPFKLASYCHCGNCRKQSGNFGSVSLGVPGKQMQILSGEELLESWQPEPGLVIRFFCKRCGSSVFSMDDPDSGTRWVRMGVLDADPGLRPTRHTWVGSAPAWLPVPEDGLPRYEQRSHA